MKTATVVGAMYMIIVGIFFIPFALLLLAAGTSGTGGGNAGAVLVVGLLAVLVYGLVGWVVTAIACAVYNLAAGWVGGIEVQVESVQPPAPPPSWGPINAAPPPAQPTAPPPTWGGPGTQPPAG
jgi:hypothetical protein